MQRLSDWLDAAWGGAFARALGEDELALLRGRGNRGDLDLLRVGPGVGAASLQRIEGTRFEGRNLLFTPGVRVEDARVEGSVLGAAKLIGGRVSRSLVGDSVVLEDGAVVLGAALLPLRRRGPAGRHVLGAEVRASRLVDSVLWGGSDLGPYAHARGHSIVGPFAHVGSGSELKAACVLGATPRNRIELPHRSYFGNACAKALHVAGDFGTEPWLQALRENIAALYGDALVEARADEDVFGAVQPRETLRLRGAGGRERILEVEGVNLGALTTTSNFDPRNGGAKLPSNVEAGARFGVLAIAQSPVHVERGVLVASGAKITGGSVPPGSLVLPRGADAAVLPGYLDATKGRLGEGVAETVALTRAYLRQLLALAEAVHDLSARASGFERVGLWRTAAALDGQGAELTLWLSRYLAVCERSVALLREDEAKERSDERRARLRARIREQARTADLADAQRAELAAWRERSEWLVKLMASEAEASRLLDEEQALRAHRALEDRAFGRSLEPAPAPIAEGALRRALLVSLRPDAMRLFGTSGIRGRFAPSSPALPSEAFTGRGVFTPALAALAGRAVARVLRRRGELGAIHVSTDVRASGAALSNALCEGLRDEGVAPVVLGIATTPAAVAFGRRGVVLVLTASHNPAPDNGLKVFVDGLPLRREAELEVEAELRALEFVARQGFALASTAEPTLARGRDLEDADADDPEVPSLLGPAGAAQRARLGSACATLGMRGALRGSRLSLDLAHGAAGARRDGRGAIVPSAPLLHWLDEGVVVVAYGALGDGARINDRVGAGYIYGEGRARCDETYVEVHPTEGELGAFARGLRGHGLGDAGPSERAPASRCLFWPDGLALPEKLAEHAAATALGHRVLEDVDTDEALAAAVDEALAGLPPLPALAVDGDADRMVLTDETLAARGTPYLTGDDLLRLFATMPDVRRVAFTVESGLGLEKLFAVRGVDFDVTTVGDRAVAECLLAHAPSCAPGLLVGGEPSGHLLLVRVEGDGDGRRVSLCDDPFELHLHALALMRGAHLDLGALVAAFEAEAPEPHTARKPDAFGPPDGGRAGLTLREKAALRLRFEGALSPYAKALVAFYPPRLCAAWTALFGGKDATSRFTAVDYEGSFAEPFEGRRELLVGEAEVDDGGAGKLRVRLQQTTEDFFGPDDVVLRFYAPDAEGREVKIGELCARNSGTSPKNAAYHKLWPIHPASGARADGARLRAALERLAAERAAFTDAFVKESLRGQP